MTYEDGKLRLPNERYIGYRKRTGCTEKPGIIYCAGFLSNLDGTKARFLDEYCEKKNLSYIRFDYIGHQFSSGSMDDFCVGLWKQNTLDVLDQLTQGPQILVGSSIGGWISTLVAMERPQRIHSLLTIANAADIIVPSFRWTNMKYVSLVFAYWCKTKLSSTYEYFIGGETSRHNEISDVSDEDNHRNKQSNVTPTFSLLTDARSNSVYRYSDIPVTCPVRLLHGLNDGVVPPQNSLELAQKISSDDVEVRFVKDADHRFSKPENLLMICAVIDELLGKT